MNEWERGDNIHYFGGEGIVYSVRPTKNKTFILTIISDDGLLRQLSSELACVQPQ